MIVDNNWSEIKQNLWKGEIVDNQNKTWVELPNVIMMHTIMTACAWCRKVKRHGWDEREQTSWVNPNELSHDQEVLVSHSICPQCSRQIRDELKTA
jgi:hypothetical protein